MRSHYIYYVPIFFTVLTTSSALTIFIMSQFSSFNYFKCSHYIHYVPIFYIFNYFNRSHYNYYVPVFCIFNYFKCSHYINYVVIFYKFNYFAIQLGQLCHNVQYIKPTTYCHYIHYLPVFYTFNEFTRIRYNYYLTLVYIFQVFTRSDYTDCLTTLVIYSVLHTLSPHYYQCLSILYTFHYLTYSHYIHYLPSTNFTTSHGLAILVTSQRSTFNILLAFSPHLLAPHHLFPCIPPPRELSSPEIFLQQFHASAFSPLHLSLHYDMSRSHVMSYAYQQSVFSALVITPPCASESNKNNLYIPFSHKYISPTW